MTSTELIRAENQPSMAWVSLLEPATRLAKLVEATEFVPTALRGRPAAIVAAILAGQELGVQPMTALAQIAIIDGKPALSATLMRGMVLARGHEVWFEECSTQHATCRGRRRGADHVTAVTWSMDDARRAGLDGKPNWKRYPRAMLEARASSEVCRLIFADVLGGLVYSVEELEDGFDFADRGGSDNGTTASPTTRRRRRTLPEVAVLQGGADVVDAEPPLPEPDGPTPAPPPLTVNRTERSRPSAPAASEAPTEPEPGSRRRRMFALLREVGINDRGDRLSFSVHVIGRTVASSTAMSDAEIDSVCNVLVDHIEGRRAIRKAGGGWVIDELVPDGGEPEPPLSDDDLLMF